jgi:hypothetical protein
MKHVTIFTLCMLCCSAIATAEVYTWTDDQNVVIFTDNPARIPSRYSSSMQMSKDGIIRIPGVQKKIRMSERKMLQAIVPTNRLQPDVVTPMQIPLGNKATPTPSDLTQPPTQL